MPTNTLIEDFRDIGHDFFRRNSRGQQELQQYTWQLSAICSLIRHTHAIVVGKLDEIEAAESVVVAQQAIRELQAGPLTDAFRTQGLCDVFEGMGRSLLRLVEGGHTGPPDQVPEPLEDPEKRFRWLRFCDVLIGREAAVGELYAEQLQALVDAGYNAGPYDLPAIKSQAASARHILTTQMSDFDALSRQFTRALVQ